jgi:CheY-like chemotaxis protein
VGISAEALPHVFNLFMRADRGPDPFQGGLGIGLTVARRLVELHGGSVEAHSDGPGRGSEFVVRLPAAAQAKRERPRDGAGDGKPLRVLVVDDSVDAAQSLGYVLESWGHSVQTAYDGPAAIEAVRERRPDVVLLDIGMPGMNGYVVAERLRRLPGAEELILVAVTGYGQEDDRTRAREAGFDYHMVKPVEPADLKELLDAAGKVVRGATAPLDA